MYRFLFLCSHFANEIYQFISFKRRLGRDYQAEIKILHNFDNFLFDKYSDATYLSKEIILEWAKLRPEESDANRKRRISCIRQFCKYLNDKGMEAWKIPERYFPYPKKYVPYIFSIEEIQRFIKALDEIPDSIQYPHRRELYRLAFQLLICCGMRLGEVRHLRFTDYNRQDRLIKIEKSKGKNRLVVFNDYINKRFCAYIDFWESYYQKGDYIFSFNRGEKPLSSFAIHNIFREILSIANIKYLGKGRGPRIHDLRHTAVVHRIRIWLMQNKDLRTLLPYFWTYLGHESYYEMAYYFHLVEEIWPKIMNNINEVALDLIPSIPEEEDTYAYD